MTDEEIEFALKQYATGGGRNVMNMDWAGTLDYINRIKAENERLMKAHINEFELLTSEMKNGEIDMKFGGEFCDAFVYSIVQMFKQNYGKNFVTATFEMDDRETSDKYALTIQRIGEETPAEQLSRLKAENENMHGEIMSLRAYIDNHEEIWKSNAQIENKQFIKNMKNVLEIEKEQIRKDTAKEILDKIWYALNNGVLFPVICNLKEEYGVEVDDE